MDDRSYQERANLDSVRRIAIYLEGIKVGRGGSFEPLGTIVIDELWKVIAELEEFRKELRVLPFASENQKKP